MQDTKLTLTEALRSSRLADFIAQKEAEDVGPVDEPELMEAIEATIKQPRSEDRTLRSASHGGSAEK